MLTAMQSVLHEGAVPLLYVYSRAVPYCGAWCRPAACYGDSVQPWSDDCYADDGVHCHDWDDAVPAACTAVTCWAVYFNSVCDHGVLWLAVHCWHGRMKWSSDAASAHVSCSGHSIRHQHSTATLVSTALGHSPSSQVRAQPWLASFYFFWFFIFPDFSIFADFFGKT